MNTKQTAIQPTRSENYPEWYQQVIRAADLADLSPVRGCMVIKPWGYAIWENMQKDLDARFKATGHSNAYFPLFIPLSFLEREAKHVEGFAKECAVVTHHRLEASADGKLVPAGELEEPLVVRPTSETIIGAMFSKWTQSYKDLPILINQWANVVRWELRTRMFLRTTEFLWQEGHTAHATADEARQETRQMLDIYKTFAEEVMAMPVIQGEKTESERFPGAVNTYTIEAMMQDGKALQAGTSHFLGQNFAKAQDIAFTNAQGEKEFAWTTSWGVSTRLIGGLIMTHSDDDGLVLPPRLAPQHVVIIPVKDDDDVLAYCDELAKQIGEQMYAGDRVRVMVDKKDMRSSEKIWKYVKQGVPIRLEIGKRELESAGVFMGRRDKDVRDKENMSRDEFVKSIASILDEIQSNLFTRAKERLEQNSKEIHSVEEFEEYFSEEKNAFAICYAADNSAYEETLKKLKVSPRLMPLEDNDEPGTCIFTGAPNSKKIIFARSY